MSSKLVLQLIQECIKEQMQALKEKPEAQPDDIFGQYLFAPSRNDIPIDASREPNTPPEKEVLKALQAHVAANDTPQLGKWFNILYDLVHTQGKYKKLLKVPSNYKYAYRLITVDDSALRSILPQIKDVSKLHNLDKDEVHVHMGGVYKHKREVSSSPVSSWTVDHKAIADMIEGEFSFGMMHMDKNKYNYTVLFVAPIQGNKFLINPSDEFYAAIDTISMADEKEILGYGPIKLSKIFYKLVHAPSDQEDGQYKSVWQKTREEEEQEVQYNKQTLGTFYQKAKSKLNTKIK